MTKPRPMAFAGLGRMGIGMAMRLLDAGFDVAVYNRSADKQRNWQNEAQELRPSPPRPLTERKMCDQGLVDVDESKVIDIARAAKLED